MILGPHTITVLRAERVESDYGTGTSLDWDRATSTEVPGCSVQPAPSTEFTVDRDLFITRYQVFVPPSADVRAGDRIAWNGEVFDVDGDVLRWEFGSLSHQVINLRRSDEA